jgi:glycosyltransferase involved in cell wall biosynthesis
VAVVVATRDRAAFLEDALRTLAEVLRPVDELVVVDNGSRDGATVAVAQAAGVRVIRCDRPGASAARNAGIGATTAPIVAVTDDDCLPRQGWTAALEAAFGDPDVGFVTGRVAPDRADADSLVQHDDPRPATYRWPDDPMHFGHGANSAFRRTAVDAVGGYDEHLGPGTPLRAAEDHDLFWRLLHAGWEGRYEPTAVVAHRAWRSRRDLLAIQWSYGLGTGALARKARRIDPAVGRRLLRTRLWEEGLARAWHALRRGWELPAAGLVVKVAGVVAGYASAMRYDVRDGHLHPRRG